MLFLALLDATKPNQKLPLLFWHSNLSTKKPPATHTFQRQMHRYSWKIHSWINVAWHCFHVVKLFEFFFVIVKLMKMHIKCVTYNATSFNLFGKIEQCLSQNCAILTLILCGNQCCALNYLLAYFYANNKSEIISVPCALQSICKLLIDGCLTINSTYLQPASKRNLSS